MGFKGLRVPRGWAYLCCLLFKTGRAVETLLDPKELFKGLMLLVHAE